MVYESKERIGQGELKEDGQLTPGVESLKKKKKGQRNIIQTIQNALILKEFWKHLLQRSRRPECCV